MYGIYHTDNLPTSIAAQTGGEAGIQGTITDRTDAVVPNAVVTIKNQNTQVSTTHPATDDGLYTIAPIIPGTYTVMVTAPQVSASFVRTISRSMRSSSPL